MSTENTDGGRSILQHGREIYYGGQEPGASLDVFIQDQDTPPFQYYLMQELKTDILLVTGTAIDDEIIYVNAGHGFAVGDYMSIREGAFQSQVGVTNVSSNDITLASPLSNAYTTDAQVIRGNIEMNISGSYADQEFLMTMWGETPVDIQTVIVTMQHGTAGDDSKFGGITALTNGLLFSKIDDTVHQHLGNYRSNQDFTEFGADVVYTDKAGGGNHGTNVTFDVKNSYGVVIRVDPRINGLLKATVQDDLNTLLRLRVSLMGQLTLGE